MSKTTAMAIRQPISRPALYLALLLIAVTATSLAVVHQPWLTAGVVFGALVLVVALTRPLALVALMLMIGPVDLSFLTGGFKSLFPEMGGLDMNGIRLLGATAGFLGFIMISPRAQRAALGPLGRVWLVFLAYAAVGLATSADPLEGARLYLKIAYPFLTFLIVIGLAESREQVLTLLKYTLIAAAVIVIVINPIFALKGAYEIDADGFRRVRGIGAHENPFSFYLMAMILISFTRMVLRSHWRYAILIVALSVWLLLTYTRITMLATAVGLVFAAGLVALATRNRKVLIGGGIVVGILCIIGVPAVLQRSLGFVPTFGELVQLIRNPATLYEAINWQGRQVLWALAWGIFMTSPLMGLGLGSSTAYLRENFSTQIDVVHNEYLRLATDTGIIGVVLFTIAALLWLREAIRLSRSRDLVVREFAIAAAAVILSWGIIALTDNAFDYYTPFTQYAGFLLAGAVVASRDAKAEDEADAEAGAKEAA